MPKFAYDYSKLRGRIREIYGTQEKFADAMRISNTSISAKLNGKVEWTQDEMLAAAQCLDYRYDEIPMVFFTVKN